NKTKWSCFIMNKVNVNTFKKQILNKGGFNEYIVTPYASRETHFKVVLITSDNVEVPTWLTHYNKKLALILPASGRIYDSISENISIIAKHTGVAASYFGLFTIENELLFTIQNF